MWFLLSLSWTQDLCTTLGKTALELMYIFWSWRKAHIAFLSINDCSNIYARICATNIYSSDKLFVSNLCLQLVCFQIVGESEVLLSWSFWGNILWSSYELLMVCFDKNIGYLFHFFKWVTFFSIRSDQYGHLVGVQTTRRAIYCRERVIMAAGAWSGELMKNAFEKLSLPYVLATKPRKVCPHETIC